ncbi:hypothetical protein V9T40_013824 [Parthenolecanium corni]|uniref:UDP-glucuronosyltransferase n=1 Tax=Parthenolecanium corni TaxID=536013 RepID=A0AAN9TDD1_9HEMI
MTVIFLILFCSFTCLCWLPAQSYKILGVFPFPSRSHYAMMDVIMAKLAEKGHSVSVYSPYPKIKPAANLREFSLANCTLSTQPADMSIDTLNSLMASPLMSVFFMSTMSNVSVESIRKCEAIQQLLESDETFDLLITESFMYDVNLLFAHKFKVPFIAYIPNNLLPWHADRMGNPSNPSYVPALVSGYLSSMNFWQRLHNFALYTTSVVLHNLITLKQNDETMKAILGPNTPSLYETVRQTSLFFTYTHSSLNPVAPLVPGIVEIAGAHIKRAKPLPSDIEKFINESKHGVVYFCMGSLLRSETFTEEKRDAFLYAFSKIPQRVLWKWEADNLPGKSDNIMTVKWMPQRDVLAHPNIKLFISHGGLLGTSEAIYEGVPILGIPIFGDQKTNVKSIEANGAGELLDYNSITKEIVLEKVQRILNNPKYMENAKQLSERYRDRPMSPLDTAVYWIEYVIRHKGAPHLRTAAVDMPLYQYLLLDVIAFLLVVFISTLAILYYISKFVFKLITNRSSKKPKKTDKKAKAS